MATTRDSYKPQPVPTDPSGLRAWLDTEHRRIAQSLRNVVRSDMGEVITGAWTFDGLITFNDDVTFNDPVLMQDDSGTPLTIKATFDGAYTAVIDNDSNGTANAARWAANSGDASLSMFVAGSGRTSTIVTDGPTGAQGVIRMLGAHPLIFGTSNTARLTIDGDGVATFAVAGATFKTSVVISGDSIAGLTMVDEDGGTDEKALHVRQNSGVTNFYFTDDDTPTSVTGANIALQLTRSGKTPLTVRLPQDNHELRFGAGGDDLAIYHDGTENFVDSNTGSLKVRDSAGAIKFQINSTGVAFNAQTPAARPDYTVTNPSTDRAFDVSSAAIGEVRAVLGTLIADLIAIGLLQ